MVKQYPHFLFVLVSGGTSVQDSEGNWIASQSTWRMHSVCREETNGKGQQIVGADGKATVYSSAVYLPKSAGSIAEGTEIFISNENSENGPKRAKGTCLKFSVGQLSSRLWL